MIQCSGAILRRRVGALAQRIEQLIGGQVELFPLALERQWEAAAQRHTAMVIQAKVQWGEGPSAAVPIITPSMSRP